MHCDEPVDLDVLVIGAGPVGATAALELLRSGIPASRLRIIDAAHGPADLAKASSLWPRTLELFRMAHPSIYTSLVERGVRIDKLTVLERDCESSHRRAPSTLISLRMDGNVPGSEIQCLYALEQFATEQILRDALQSSGVQVEWNTSLENLQETQQSVKVRVAKEEDSFEEFRARYVVGCDGAHSKVRHLLGVHFKGETLRDVSFFVAHARVEGLPANVAASDTLSVTLTRQGLCMVIPFRDGRKELVFDLSPQKLQRVFGEDFEAQTKVPKETHLQHLLQEIYGEHVRVVEPPQWLSAFFINSRQVEDYRKGRVFMCGDACHIHSPFGGQGMNYGIQDAFNLGWKLGAVLKHNAAPRLLRSYTHERYAAGHELVKATEAQTKGLMAVTKMRSASEAFTKGMNAVLRTAQQLSIVSAASKAFLVPVVSQLWVNYRDSWISKEHWYIEPFQLNFSRLRQRRNAIHAKYLHSRVCAGERAPNVQITHQGASRWLQPMCSQNAPFTVLLFEAAPGYEDSKVWHGGREKDLTLLAWEIRVLGEGLLECIIVGKGEEEAQQAYGVSGQCLMLLRPDGYIAFRSQPASRTALLDFMINQLEFKWLAPSAPEEEDEGDSDKLKSIEARITRNNALLGLSIILLAANLGATLYHGFLIKHRRT